jgi:hypothetical protein
MATLALVWGEWQTSCCGYFTPSGAHGTHWTRGQINPTGRTNTVEKTCPCWESNPAAPVIQLLVWTLQRATLTSCTSKKKAKRIKQWLPQLIEARNTWRFCSIMPDNKLAWRTGWLSDFHDWRLRNNEAAPPSPPCFFMAQCLIKDKGNFNSSCVLLDLYKVFCCTVLHCCYRPLC